jgi:glycolate oxidase FAD binding subunit
VTKPTDLPSIKPVAPANAEELVDVVRRAFDEGTAIYPLGGGTSLDFGLPATRPGIGLSLSRLNRVIDFPSRDMTITAEAGITMAALAAELGRCGQRLPIDVPQPERATLGGVIATNTSGPRRYGSGTLRDYVIGISAVDGRGTPFKGGGRVVKNVAGYDFCKLLTGSMGTLAVITQATLKVVPVPEAAAFLYHDLSDIAQAEPRLAALVTSQVKPAAIELLAGPAWRDDPAFDSRPAQGSAKLLVALEGTTDEVAWMEAELTAEWRDQGARAQRVAQTHHDGLWRRLADFPSQLGMLVIKANMLPSAVTGFLATLFELDPGCSVEAHAGNGIVIARLSLPPAEATRLLIRRLQPAAATGQGNVVVLSYPEGMELTRQVIWGAAANSTRTMRVVKEQFDPKELLNPGRFVY